MVKTGSMKVLGTVALALVLASCGGDSADQPAAIAQPARPATTSAPARPVPGEPETFLGEITCAGCPGQRNTLTLFPDKTFRMRTVFVGVRQDGGDDIYHDLGRWSRDGSNVLMLSGGKEAAQLFRFVDADRIRGLDNEGNEIQTALNTELVRQPEIDRVNGPMWLDGMYRYLADAATVEECLTGVQYPVLIEGEHLAVEQAYLEARTKPGEAIFLSFDGEFVMRAPEPGMPEREHVRVTGLRQFWPGQNCASN
ncbi:MAG: copper resistance protein NlpE N-terminal domain-containing protein [Gammaproteobacteria bacterium]|nr:copper resistance protein NlpE N-terminal domain-containing protein [Gammaproteobacteria bacterium]